MDIFYAPKGKQYFRTTRNSAKYLMLKRGALWFIKYKNKLESAQIYKDIWNYNVTKGIWVEITLSDII